MTEEYCVFNGESGRYELCGRELHCGDCFEVRVGGEWREVRIEHCDRGWYLVGLGEPYSDRVDHYLSRTPGR